MFSSSLAVLFTCSPHYVENDIGILIKMMMYMMMMITKLNVDVRFVSSLGNIEVERLCRNTPSLSLCMHVVDLPRVGCSSV